MVNIIETNQLIKSYKNTKVVNQIDLSVEQGDIYGFLGPNGAGKTTTIRMLLGLIKPTSGDIQIFGKNLQNNKMDILRGIGSLVEYPSYYGNLTGLENLEAIRRLLQVKDKKRNLEILKVVGLTDAKDKLVKNYSLGMKQRLGIGIALLGSPRLLILDEPTNGLDPAGIQEIRELIKTLPGLYGITIMISSHLLNEVDQMANKVGIINQGQLIFQNSIEELRKKSNPRIVMRTNDSLHAESILQQEGWNVTLKENGELEINETEDSKIAYITDKLVRKNMEVYRIQEQKRSLEDIFLEITNKRGVIS
ncbi:ABC-type multidrug transport system ATPase subunit [Paenibacillus sp. SORGH_AS306]|uniref:ABC transporter ATP-binding protein n=1 Tax=unclassified Paenibacillus TaxID=185978 RepID=UPI00277FC75E|nr:MULTISPECIES: ATP-binding cassette domain-containing protein [unclassified Paenibacillus]MDQ1236182.1 ABC-type multidrug transport system ATPase subunit [Paenibacillus sp. SORGH_AS_0306]MDR6108537.1 ABC-type multidrug transport system ATPase subunit [Paenibacillus sp. SORGH_AS_0338]